MLLLILVALQTIISILSLNNGLYSISHEGHEDIDEYWPLEPRIAYGDPVEITEYPFFAGLYGCGGAIISDRWVVTAAHCVRNPNYRDLTESYVTIGGDNHDNVEFAKIKEIFIHPKYFNFKGLLINDIALIKLDKPLEFNDRIQPLKLPNCEKCTQYEVGSKHVFIGKGAEENGKPSRHLKKMEVGIFPTEDCYLESYPYLYRSLALFMPLLNDATICSVRVENLPGAGRGDSGSPLVNDDSVLVGIASHGTAPGNNRVMFLTNVEYYVPWIQQVTEYFGSKDNEYYYFETDEYSSCGEEEANWPQESKDELFEENENEAKPLELRVKERKTIEKEMSREQMLASHPLFVPLIKQFAQWFDTEEYSDFYSEADVLVDSFFEDLYNSPSHESNDESYQESENESKSLELRVNERKKISPREHLMTSHPLSKMFFRKV